MSPMTSHAAISYKHWELKKKMRYHWFILWREGRNDVKGTCLFVMPYETSLCYANFWYKLLFCREIFFDEGGNILNEKPIDPTELSRREKNSASHNKFEDFIQMVKQSDQDLDLLFSILCDIQDPIEKIVPHASICKQDKFEAFIGTKIPKEVIIYIFPMISSWRGDVRGSRKTRRWRPQARNTHVVNATK
jgi:hypothetical protein